MKRATWILVMLVSVAVIASLFGARTSAQPAGPAPKGWTYAQIVEGGIDPGNSGVDVSTGNMVNFDSATETQHAQTWSELSTKLGGKGKTILEVLNQIGSKGWELTMIRDTSTGRFRATTYYFKKPSN